jgi:hypothetical protein
MPQGEKVVAPRPLAAASGKIVIDAGWALALARRIAVSCGLGLGASPLAIALGLVASALTAVVGGAIAAAGLPASPEARGFLTGLAAIACLRASGPEEVLAALEQTKPEPVMTAGLPLAEVTIRMTLVHGSSLLPMYKSRGEALTSLRGVFSSLASYRRTLAKSLAHAPGP